MRTEIVVRAENQYEIYLYPETTIEKMLVQTLKVQCNSSKLRVVKDSYMIVEVSPDINLGIKPERQFSAIELEVPET
jgi:hypothetical protein